MTATALLVTIRPAVTTDATAVAALVEGMGGHEGVTASPGWAHQLDVAIGAPDVRVLVAEREGRVVGVAEAHARPSLGSGRREAWLGLLAVDPRWAGQGIGAALVAAVDAAAAVLGCDVVVLESAVSRDAAHRFYAAQGFAPHTPAVRLARSVGTGCGATTDTALVDRFLVAAARAVTAAAGAVAAQGAGSGGQRMGIGADGAPTSRADAAAEAAALAELVGLGVPILSEEGGWIGPDAPAAGSPWLCLDPLDGTRNAVVGHGPHATAVGLVQDGQPVAGYVLDHTTGRRWWAARGQGAWVDGRPCRVRRGPLLAVPSTGAAGGSVDVPPGFDRVRMSGCTTVDLCRVADGSLGAFADLVRGVVHVHDLAGPLAVLREAGATVVDPDADPSALIVLHPDPAAGRRLVVAADPADATLLARGGSGTRGAHVGEGR